MNDLDVLRGAGADYPATTKWILFTEFTWTGHSPGLQFITQNEFGSQSPNVNLSTSGNVWMMMKAIFSNIKTFVLQTGGPP